MEKLKKVNLRDKLATFNSYWDPKIVGRLNQQLVKVAKFKGSFPKHHHENEDELFLVVEGELFIELPEETVQLQAGEFFIVPKGTPHQPYAPEEVSVMLFEPEATLNTGNKTNEFTVTNLDEI